MGQVLLHLTQSLAPQINHPLRRFNIMETSFILSQQAGNGQQSQQLDDNRIDELISLYRYLLDVEWRHRSLATIYPDRKEERVKHLTMARMAQTWRLSLQVTK